MGTSPPGRTGQNPQIMSMANSANYTASKGPVIIYVGGEGGKICLKDQNFCKPPPVDHVNSK